MYQPDLAGLNDQDQCTVNISSLLWTCEVEEGTGPDRSIAIGGLYGWRGNKNPFMVLDIPQGWCVGSVEVTFQLLSGSIIPTLSLSLHSAERLSSNTDRTAFSTVSKEGSRQVVLNHTSPARGRYLRISMTSAQTVYLQEIEDFIVNIVIIIVHLYIQWQFSTVVSPPDRLILLVCFHKCVHRQTAKSQNNIL